MYYLLVWFQGSQTPLVLIPLTLICFLFSLFALPIIHYFSEDNFEMQKKRFWRSLDRSL